LTRSSPSNHRGHTLVVNACILSTTGYLQDAIDAQRAEGHPVSDEAIAHLSPAHFEAINPYGTLNFDIAGVLKRARRPLRLLAECDVMAATGIFPVLVSPGSHSGDGTRRSLGEAS
jgi:hypothetical protein